MTSNSNSQKDIMNNPLLYNIEYNAIPLVVINICIQGTLYVTIHHISNRQMLAKVM